MTEKEDDFFGEATKEWNWKKFKTLKRFPLPKRMIDYVIGQDNVLKEIHLCIDEWINKLLYLRKKKWWKKFENPENPDKNLKEMLPAGPFVLMLGAAGCLVGDERIALRDGTFNKLENLGQTHLDDIHVPVYQFGKMSEKYKGIATVFHRYENQPVMEIITESGKRIVGTYNHPLLTKNGWKRLDELSTTDYLRVVTKIPCWKKNYYGFIDEKIGGLLGYALADGSIDKYALTLFIADNERELIPKLQQIIRESFDVEPSLYTRVAHGFNRTIDVHILEINRKWIADKLSFLKEKRVPIGIMQSPDSVVSSFLSWFFTGDGSVYCKGRGHYGITCEQAEKRIELLRDIQILLLRFGIYSVVKGRHLRIQRGKSIERFAKYIGFKTTRKQEKLEQLVKYVSKRRQRRNQLWERVISIKPMGVATVYDIEVPYRHHFIANGIVSHNTGKSLIGRALAEYLTEEYKKRGIKLTDVLCWHNPRLPSEPRISIHPAGKGKEIVMQKYKVEDKKSFWKKWGMRLLMFVLGGFGALTLGIGIVNIILLSSLIGFFNAVLTNIMLISIGGSLLFVTFFIWQIGKLFGGNVQQGGYSIGGVQRTTAPKLIVDNSLGRAPFVDATGHGSAQLYGCLDENTRLFTTNGIKEWQFVKEGDIVFTLNPKTEQIELQPVDKIFVYDYNGPMLSLNEKKGLNFQVTPDHKLLYRPRSYCDKIKLPLQYNKITEVMEKSRFFIPQNGNWIGRDNEKITCNLLRLIGWFISEGYYLEQRNYVAISQKKFPTEIELLLRQMNVKHFWNKTECIITDKSIVNILMKCGRYQHERFIPSEYLNLPKEKLSCLFETLMLGDGNKKMTTYYTTSLQLRDNIIELGLKLGYSISISEDKRRNNGKWRIGFRVNLSKKAGYVKTSNIKQIKYKGKVWCIQTKNHNFLIEKNGKLSFTGNSIAWDPYQSGGLGTPEHQRVSAGDVHRAHLGVLFIDEVKNLTGAEAITLLTVLEDGQLPIALRSLFHGGDSITGDTMIFFKENGNIRYRQFNELVASFENGNKIEVLCPEHMDFKCKKLMWTPVLKVFRRGKKPIKYIELINGKSIKLTKDHSLFRYNNLHSKQPLVPTTIEHGKCITINKIEVPKIDMESESENDLEFYGYWIGNGWFEANKIVGLATGKSEESKSFVYAYAKKLNVTASLKNVNGDMRLYSTELVRKMKNLGFVSGAFNKRIPEWIFFLPESKVKAFIRGYKRSDGCRYRKDRRMITQFGSVNRKLLEDFQTLFSIIGIEASISSGRLNGKKAFKSLNSQYKLTIWKDSSEDFKVNHLRNQGLLTLHRIKKIIDRDEEEVFDISTKHECFIANGILCHNTAAMAVSTEPVPAMFFFIGAGNLDSLPQMHKALVDRIAGYGRIVYMNNDMPNTVENRRKYVQFIAQETKRFNLLPFSREACKAIIDIARIKSGRNDRLTCQFRPMISIIKVASILAQNDGKLFVDKKYVDEAFSVHCKSIAKQILEKRLLKDQLYKIIDANSKPKIGQIYGLAVSMIQEEDEDEYTEMLGSVLPIRASVVKCKKKKSGSFIVTGVATEQSSWMQHSIAKVRHVILQMFNVDISQDFHTHVDFAQEIGVDGPSAGVAMTLAVISSLKNKKIKQDVAVTGEINIGVDNKIIVTPIGGTNEKIFAAQKMGFKKVCIPKKNYEHDVIPSDYTIKIVPCETIEDYMKECFD